MSKGEELKKELLKSNCELYVSRGKVSMLSGKVKSLKKELEETRKESQLMKDQFVDTRKHLQASRQDAEEKKNKAEKELAELKKNRQKVSITADAKAVIASMERAEKLEKELAEAKKERHPSHTHCVTPCDSIRIQSDNHNSYLGMMGERDTALKELAELAQVNQAMRSAGEDMRTVLSKGLGYEAQQVTWDQAESLKSGSELLAKRDRETEARVWDEAAKVANFYNDEHVECVGMSECQAIRGECRKRAKASRQTVKGDE